MTEIKKEASGTVRISDEVLMKIASNAAMEAEGVLQLTRGRSVKKAAKCTGVAVKKNVVVVAITIAVRFGTKIHKISMDVQSRVKSAIETMTGLTVAEVNVTVGAIVGEKDKR